MLEVPKLCAVSAEMIQTTPISREPLQRFAGAPQLKGPVLIVIADGVGIAAESEANAVALANTPNMDALMNHHLSRTIAAHGTAVGLPSDADMGNSEVGHNAIGAGRIFSQGATLVNDAIASGDIWQSAAWQKAMQATASQNTAPASQSPSTLHLLGLHSDGNVHAHTDHLYAICEQAAAKGVQRARIHVLLDGRDVHRRSALKYLAETESVLAELNGQYGCDFKIASGGGRMKITMDRYNADWPMVQRGFNCHVFGELPENGLRVTTASNAIEELYETGDLGDQDLPPFVVVDEHNQAVGPMADGDFVLLYNFRGDRAIEISQAFEACESASRREAFDHFDISKAPNLGFAGMLEYDGDLHIPASFLVEPPKIDNTMGHYLLDAGLGCFAVSETQKYGHVTFFWNGNRSGEINPDLETYVEIPSDNVSFDQAPQMKAAEIADATIELLRSNRFSWGRINFANGDMVGHTGNLQATIEAVEAMDRVLGRLITVIEEVRGALIFTADHGNADVMFSEASDGTRTAKTSHTTNPVPFAVHCPEDGCWQQRDVPKPGLANIAATAMALMGYEAPCNFQPSLIALQ